MNRSQRIGAVREHRRKLVIEQCERRDLMSADTLGVFAIQSGSTAISNQSVSQSFVIDRSEFQTSHSGTVMLRIQSDGLSNLGPMNLNTTRNPVHGRAIPSVWQRASGPDFLLAKGRPGAYVLSAGNGQNNFGNSYEIVYQLAGDVDGSYQVTHEDFALIRTAMVDPQSLSPDELANADVDGNGRINHVDLRLARSNFGAATAIRPLTLSTGISDETPHNGLVVRVDDGVFTAWTAPGATLVFSNDETGQEVFATADWDGYAEGRLDFLPHTINTISVSAQGTFGQSVSSSLDVDQRPTPVVILPGYSASLPKTPGELQSYLFTLGFPADQLEVAPSWTASLGIVNPYTNIMQVMASSGYVEGQDQFLVPYDWRLPIAPYDGVQDGVLSDVTGTSITQAQPHFSLGYLGNFLKNLVLTDPSVVSIDLVGHSNGGLLTRSYIQSLAYGATVTEGDVTFTLPKVEKAILLAAPSLGAAEAWPLWNNDIGIFGTEYGSVLRLLLNTPFGAIVNQGAVVTSPLGNIDLAAITDPNTGQPDPLKFLRLYVASMRDLLPTYDFLFTTGGQLTNINSDPASANQTVLDINATSSPGVNPWTSLVQEVTASFGVHPTGVNQAMQSVPLPTETESQTVIGDGTTGSIWPFQDPNPIVPPAGTIYYTLLPGAYGDTVVPFISQIATYAGDPSILVKQWGNGVASGQPTWQNTLGNVEHSPYLNNGDLLDFVRRRLLGLPVS